MRTVYFLQHLYTLDKKEDITTVKSVGIYSTREKALEAVNRLAKMPGFCDSPNLIDPEVNDKQDGFYIDPYEVNVNHMETGFALWMNGDWVDDEQIPALTEMTAPKKRKKG